MIAAQSRAACRLPESEPIVYSHPTAKAYAKERPSTYLAAVHMTPRVQTSVSEIRETGDPATGGRPRIPGVTSPLTTSSAPAPLTGDIATVLVSAEDITRRLGELAAEIERDYAGREVVLVGVLKGAVMVMADLARALTLPLEMEWMAVSSYGAGTKTSGVVRIIKDLDRDISGRDVLIVEDIVDSGLTLSWLLANLRSRQPASLEICALLRKPAAAKVEVPVRYVGFDIPNEFVVGYGLDYREKYRNLTFVGTLAPHVYAPRG